MVKIDFPVVLRHQVVFLCLDSQPCGQGGVQGKSWPGDEDVVARIAQGGNAKIQRARASGAEDDIVGGDVIANVFSHGLSGFSISKIYKKNN